MLVAGGSCWNPEFNRILVPSLLVTYSRFSEQCGNLLTI